MNYKELDVPCFGCEERHLGCHGKCDRYASFDKANKERREKIFQEKEIASAITENVRRTAKARRTGNYLRNVFY